MTEPTQDRILDAAARVMRERGLARTTTKEIARAAGCSEALLYKHFADKQEIFVRVLGERMPPVRITSDMVGKDSVAGNLERIVEQLLAFYVQSFPIAASIFSSHDLVTAHRESMHARGVGPHMPALMVRNYLEAEADAGRIARDADAEAIATALTGAALYQAFLAAFSGALQIEHSGELARSLVAVVLPALVPAGPRTELTTDD
ncbi:MULTISPECIES: TetR/AcrR family transcriptional regulator [unclassified Microbacterium]|uniref:TetR/AcrR family transcriptional regulator n=1 Tax=unclassified Microbacterium TaxID=2609290 RepID=UPI00214AD28F|nr:MULTISPECIES: TetR/AcrR family transcriptional regulator [unclassified Microbacterium]MCR2783534.1 TetR/AcrR family transcriptional regulator [Microbacterium sp. zg.B96]WIM15605.1 TetR/AcrR family transcriptional regulator [Microbacterium sp. zg-B96]